GVVGGQLQGGEAGELPGPVVQAVGQDGVGELAALPDRVVGVLHRQRFQRWLAVIQGGGVQLAEFAGQDAHRPAVGDDVVQGEQQHVILGGGPDQQYAEQGSVAQVERFGGFPGGDRGDLGFALGFWQRGQVGQR